MLDTRNSVTNRPDTHMVLGLLEFRFNIGGKVMNKKTSQEGGVQEDPDKAR